MYSQSNIPAAELRNRLRRTVKEWRSKSEGTDAIPVYFTHTIWKRINYSNKMEVNHLF
jgi:hypothetical protein